MFALCKARCALRADMAQGEKVEFVYSYISRKPSNRVPTTVQPLSDRLGFALVLCLTLCLIALLL